MTGDAQGDIGITAPGSFRDGVRALLRKTGRTQRELAGTIGLHPDVLSHKLNGHGAAVLTAREVIAIVTALAAWRAITIQEEAVDLLTLASVPPGAIPPPSWAALPLADLDRAIPETDSRGTRASYPTAREPMVRMSPAPLPAPFTPFIGRIAESATVRAALRASRLVTLTGVGGIGKTRLALQVAGDLAGVFPDGVAFVDLTPIRDPAMLPNALARALGLREQPQLPIEEQLCLALRPARMLLVVDNVEHVVEEAALLSRLLAAAPSLSVLATSRVPLHLYGEREVRVPPLPVPSDAPGSVDDPAASGAVQLFMQRARAALPAFDPAREALDTIGAICRALDGLPLAIELAAARIRLFPPDALLPLLDTRLDVLVGGPRNVPARQQTLRATLDWSYRLLAPEARVLFARLGVFTGSFDAAAAAAICDPASDPVVMLGRLATLAEHSLLEVIGGPIPRFRLLETLRAYAVARLAESGEQDTMRERHAQHYLALAENAHVPDRPASDAYLSMMEEEHDNLRAALEWAQEDGQAELSLRLVCVHHAFWVIRGRCVEGGRRARAALGLEGPVEESLRLRALSTIGTMARLQGDLARSRGFLERALGGAREAENDRQVAVACLELGIVESQLGRRAEAQSLVEEGAALVRGFGDIWRGAQAAHFLATLAYMQGENERARVLWEESLTLCRAVGDQANTALMLANLAGVALRAGEIERAKSLYLDSLSRGERVGYLVVRIEFVEDMAEVALREGDATMAARLLGAADVARAEFGEVREPQHSEVIRGTVAAGIARIGENGWTAAWSEGQTMTLAAAIDLARTYAAGRRSRTS